MNDDLFAELCHRLGLRPDRRGDAAITCPHCGKEPKRGQVHCHVREEGYFKCHVCGEGGSLRKLWRILVGDEEPTRRERLPRRMRQRARPRYDIKQHDPMFWVEQYETSSGRIEAWKEYAPSLPESWIRAYRLGVGALPPYSSRCRHERLQAPLLSGGECVGFRSRAISCDCTKWLAPGGTVPVLYNGARILKPEWMGASRAARIGDCAMGRAAGDTLWVVENVADALLVETQMHDSSAVATLGVSMWRDEWTRAIVANPIWDEVIVAFDNDAAGNVTPAHAAEIEQRWREKQRKRGIPEDKLLLPPACGNRLVNRLLAGGVPAALFEWPAEWPVGSDVGDLLRDA